jgi:hypothetical protein
VAFLVRDLDEKLNELAKSGIEPVMRYRLLMDAPADSRDNQPAASKKNCLELNEVYLNSDKVGGAMIQLMEFKQIPAS